MSFKEGKTRRVLTRVAAVAAVAGFGVAGLSSSASADITIQQYVALGDSYASGVGAGEYADDGSDCYRSANAYAHEANAALGERLWFEACSGARVEDVVANQLSHLYRVNTEHVTIGVGGNDAGFSSVLGACAGTNTAQCETAITNARNIITNSLPAELDDLYTQVRNRAFSAEIVVVGNPRLFNETSCAGALAITPAEQVLLNDAADLLAETTAAVAADHGFDFADPREAFDGHGVCSADPWILGYTGNLESFHPNAAGQAAYADVVIPTLDY